MTTPERRIEILKELGVTVTEEMKDKEYKHSLDSMERMYGKDWEATADALAKVLDMSEIPTAECRNCLLGIAETPVYTEDLHGIDYEHGDCHCCNGDYLHCPNCVEGTGNREIAEDARADMKGHL